MKSGNAAHDQFFRNEHLAFRIEMNKRIHVGDRLTKFQLTLSL